MKTWLVYETEYPEEGSIAVDAYTKKGALRRVRKMTGGRRRRDELTPLDAIEGTLEVMVERERLDAECEA
jgi:hypothetical protein